MSTRWCKHCGGSDGSYRHPDKGPQEPRPILLTDDSRPEKGCVSVYLVACPGFEEWLGEFTHRTLKDMGAVGPISEIEIYEWWLKNRERLAAKGWRA